MVTTETRLVAAASHDLRQPIQAIGLWIEILREQSRDAVTRRILSKIAETAKGVESVVESLLDISKLDMGAIEVQPVQFPIATLLRRVEATFTPAAHAKGLELRVRESPRFVRSDPLLLERVVSNLVANAIRYCECGGVLVGCRDRGKNVSIEVRDTGIGIPADRLDDIFREFVQIRGEGRERNRGAGLGLSIAQRIAGQLGHKINVDSRLSVGSRFRIEVPRAASPAENMADVPAATDPLTVAGAFVVFIDDEAPIREAMGQLLRCWGVHCVIAASAAKAIQQLRGHLRTPDLLISDYRLADAQTGPDAITQIRAALGESIPSIIVTGENCASITRHLSEKGVVVVRKPIQPDALRFHISEAFGQRPRLQLRVRDAGPNRSAARGDGRRRLPAYAS